MTITLTQISMWMITMSISMFGDTRRIASSNACGCTGQNGERKKLYLTENQAQDQAGFAKLDRQVDLKVYSCPYGHGYHLTSKAL